MTKSKKLLVLVLIINILIICLTGCASWNRFKTDLKSEFNNGIERTINVYTADGELLATYTGKIDLASDTTYVKFDFEGKRYIYYNCFVESIADIN